MSTSNKSFRIPIALDAAGHACRPDQADRNQNYYCPACGDQVIIRHGAIRTAHFAHPTSASCQQETILHQTAKRLIQQIVQAWKADGAGPRPQLQRACRGCGAAHPQPIPDTVERAVLEYRLPDGLRVDVALLDAGNTVRAAVEIRVTHPVDADKARRLSVPFMELAADEVIKEPTVWKPVTDRLKPYTCDSCKRVYKNFQARARKVAQAARLTLLTAYYRYGLCRCYRCRREILVFTWPGKARHDDRPPRIMPPPRTVQFQATKTLGERYWANTCPHCRAVQGDWYLYGPEGPFFTTDGYKGNDDSDNGLPSEEETDTPTAFKTDLYRIACYWDYRKIT